jgi:hypothetical protein
MVAVFVPWRIRQVHGVGGAAAAHGDVGPFSGDGARGDDEGLVDGGALGLVAGDGVAVVGVSFVEVPAGELDGFGVTVEADGEGAGLGIDGRDGTEVTVEDSDSGVVLLAEDPVSGLVLTAVDVEDRPDELTGLGYTGFGLRR